MTRIFVSYSRSDRRTVKKLIPLLREHYGYENVWWDQNFVGGELWWEEILKEIAQCDIFLYLLSPQSLSRPYCLAEREEARRLHKQILYVKLRRFTNVPEIIAQSQFIELIDKINYATITPITRAINKYTGFQPLNYPPISDNPTPLPTVSQREPHNYINEYIVIIIIGVIVGVVVSIITQADRFAPKQNPPTTAVAQVASANATTPIVMSTSTASPSRIPRPTQPLTPTSTRVPSQLIIYQEDFEDGVANGWETNYGVGTFEIRQDDNGNSVWWTRGATRVLRLPDDVENYAFEARIQYQTDFSDLNGSTIGFLLNVQLDNILNCVTNNYLLYIDFLGNYHSLNYVNVNSGTCEWTTHYIAGNFFDMASNRWYTLRIEVRDSNISTFINDNLLFTANNTVVSSNIVGLWSCCSSINQEFHFDDILIWSLD